MNISLVVSVLNEETTIAALLDSIISQIKKPDEVILIDGGSSDRTRNIIRKYQKLNKYIKLLEFRSTRSEARNIGVKSASGDIIVTTDAGCTAEKQWVKNITDPFRNPKIDMVAGFYKMIDGGSSLRKALSVFLGVTPDKFNDYFLPSARSLAFRKSLWKKVGGFPEGLKDTAEDTMFNYNVIHAKAEIVRVKSAIVYWQLPLTLEEGIKKMFLYAKGDAKSGIWWNPVKGFSTHNIKILLVFFRYIIALYILLIAQKHKILILPLLFGILFYIYWAFKKVYEQTDSLNAGFYGIILQITSDLAVMGGFISGLLNI